MHLPAKANSLSVQTFMANKSLSDSDSWSMWQDVLLKMSYYGSLCLSDSPGHLQSHLFGVYFVWWTYKLLYILLKEHTALIIRYGEHFFRLCFSLMCWYLNNRTAWFFPLKHLYNISVHGLHSRWLPGKGFMLSHFFSVYFDGKCIWHLSEILIYQALHSQSVNKLRKLYCLRPQGDKNITRHGATSLSASKLR